MALFCFLLLKLFILNLFLLDQNIYSLIDFWNAPNKHHCYYFYFQWLLCIMVKITSCIINVHYFGEGLLTLGIHRAHLSNKSMTRGPRTMHQSKLSFLGLGLWVVLGRSKGYKPDTSMTRPPLTADPLRLTKRAHVPSKARCKPSGSPPHQMGLPPCATGYSAHACPLVKM